MLRPRTCTRINSLHATSHNHHTHPHPHTHCKQALCALCSGARADNKHAYTAPWLSMALATLVKPAMFAPSARVTPNSLAAEDEAA